VSKSTVTRTFFGSLIAIIAGSVLAAIAVAIAITSGVFVIEGSTVVEVRPSLLAFALVVIGVVGAVAIIGGVIGNLVAWIGALLNTAQLESKTWFLVLLLLGIFNIGFIAMIAYVVAGPDGNRTATPFVPSPTTA